MSGLTKKISDAHLWWFYVGKLWHPELIYYQLWVIRHIEYRIHTYRMLT
jgi:hypothetical protein